MLQNKSLEDFNCVGDGQLFTELTPKEAAAIEGGYSLYLQSLQCIREQPPAWAGSDEISVRVNGRQVAYNANMNTGTYWNINLARQYTNPVTVSIWEDDIFKDDFIGAITVSRSTQSGFVDFFGNSSHYRLTYRVF